MTAFEINFDGLVGPTHNYSGLSYGNVASMQNQELISNPKEAALQGLEKMKLLSSLGIVQGVLPPHERPHIKTLKALGFQGSDESILSQVLKENRALLFSVSSSAAMWTANAATVSSSFDSMDKKVHFVPANLSSNFHRAIEANFTSRLLKLIFKDPSYFEHHAPLLCSPEYADEGAANHTRLCSSYSAQGVHLFVFGRYGWKNNLYNTKIFPARQTFEASKAISKLLSLPKDSLIFAQQNPEAIDAGVFHNDVACVGNKNVILYHKEAYLNSDEVIHQLKLKLPSLITIEISNVSLKEAVHSYLFNSQLISLDDQSMALIAPTECYQIPSVQKCLEQMIQDGHNPIKKVIPVSLKESMQNGGGPACLRLRVVLTKQELNAIHQDVILDDQLYDTLKGWIKKHYRDRLLPKDLADPQLLREVKEALNELSLILKLPIYSD